MHKSNLELTYVNQDPFKYKEIVKNPFITGKTTRLLENNQYCFIVHPKSTKDEIKSAIEILYDVKVVKVNTAKMARKSRRVGKYLGWRSQYKKAIITLSEGDRINLFAEN